MKKKVNKSAMRTGSVKAGIGPMSYEDSQRMLRDKMMKKKGAC